MFFGWGYGFSVDCVSYVRIRQWGSKLLTVVAVVTVVVCVRVFRGTNVVHLVCRAALHAAGDGLLAGQLGHVSSIQSAQSDVASYGDPEHVVRVARAAGAADILLVASRVDNDGVLEGACNSISHQVDPAAAIASKCPSPDPIFC